MDEEKKSILKGLDDEALLALIDARRSGDQTFWEASFDWGLILEELENRPHLDQG